MNLKPWLDRGDIQRVEVTNKSIEDLLSIVRRDLKDSQVEALSVDRRFATAYGAALNLASYVIRKAGFRVTGKVGHHKVTFDLAGLLLGKEAAKYVDYFDICRRKRNKVDYDLTDVVSETETKELIDAVKSFENVVLNA